ncbi:MAG: metal-dependent hydrolase [Nostoc sp. S4]|nr:metal-dependent hydrolase [Nostoc sp. S4]
MLGISHLLISGTATSLLLGTASPTLIAAGAIAGLLPNIDISTSPAGRVLPWVSAFFEAKMPHRSCTHSLVASAVVASVRYGVALFNPQFINLVHALSIGYFFGWFADVFTRGGVEMFWPSPVRCVCPGNRNLRLRTGSNVEYFVLIILIAIAQQNRPLRMTISVDSPSFLKVKVGQEIKQGDVISDIYIECDRLDKQKKSITLQIENLKSKTIPEPFKPKESLGLKPLPPAIFSEESAAIAQKWLH